MQINADTNRITPPPEARRKARRGVILANGPAVQGVYAYRAFEWPQGSGETWRIAPVGYKVGARLAELEIEQLQIAGEWKDSQGPSRTAGRRIASRSRH